MTEPGAEEFISDAGFTGSLGAIRNHYERLSGVYEALATLGDQYPTLGFAGNNNWYHYQDPTDPEALEAGWNAQGRVKTLENDWERILDEDLGTDDRKRELFNISSWKSAESVNSWRYRRWEPGEDQEAWEDGEKPTPNYETLRGFGFWADLDLADKAGRANLTEDERELLTVREKAGSHGADEFQLSDEPGEVGLADLEIAKSPVWEHYTLRLAIHPVHLDGHVASPIPGRDAAGPNATLASFGPGPRTERVEPAGVRLRLLATRIFGGIVFGIVVQNLQI